MTATNTPRPRRLAGHRPSALSSTGRPRKIADSRRAAVRSAAESAVGPTEATGVPTGPAAGSGGGDGRRGQQPPSSETGRSFPSGAATAVSGAEGRSGSRFQVGRLTVVLLAVAVVLAVAVGLLGWDLMRIDARADARKAAQVVAAESMETILSYDHAHYDKGVAAAKTLMTGEFAKKYARTVHDVRPAVMETESVVKAKVVASSVVSAEPDRVKTLLFVNQTTTGKQVQQPRVDLNRVVVTLVRGDDGAWLVSDVDAL